MRNESIYGYGDINEEVLPREFKYQGTADYYICREYPVIITGVNHLKSGGCCIELKLKGFYDIELSYVADNNVDVMEGAEYTAYIKAFTHKENGNVVTRFCVFGIGIADHPKQ